MGTFTLKEEGVWAVNMIMKFVLGFVAAIFIIIAAFWGSFVYVSDYKITKADTFVSPDGTYEPAEAEDVPFLLFPYTHIGQDGERDFRCFTARGIFCGLDVGGKKVCVASGFK